MTKKITIIGGGTAGWLTALYIEKYWQGTEITVIESSKIGILGAGEGTTPNFPYIINQLGIDEVDFLDKTNTTKKTGVEFINWSGDGSKFLHEFQQDKSFYGYHFDARLVAKYLTEVSLKRGIKHLDNEVISFIENDKEITNLILDNHLTIETDFVFDCSGFHRLIIGKHFDTEWISYTDELTVNSAFAFFLPQEENLNNESKTKTLAVSMKYGWMWMAPLKHRWGCGYIYDNNFINFDQAKKEVEDYLKKEIHIVKHFNFNAGVYKKSWIKNCIAIGLSSGFIEPLEATALMSSIIMLDKLKDLNFNSDNRDLFNDFTLKLNEQNMLFLRHHYVCNRDDSDFWINYKNKKIPEKLKKLYDENGNFLHLTDDDLKKIFTNQDEPFVFRWASYNLIHKTKKRKKTIV